MDLRARARAPGDGPDLVIANDPDADRLRRRRAPAADGRLRCSRGNQVGVLLAEHLLSEGRAPDNAFATTIVSSPLLVRDRGARAGLPYEETLTGFKWIARLDGLRFGYEEALGYRVDPLRPRQGRRQRGPGDRGADRDPKRNGRTLSDLLDEIALGSTAWTPPTSPSVRVADLSVIADAMVTLRERPPSAWRPDRHLRRRPERGQRPVPPYRRRPRLLGGTRRRREVGRVIVRRSGTEPKSSVTSRS